MDQQPEVRTFGRFAHQTLRRTPRLSPLSPRISTMSFRPYAAAVLVAAAMLPAQAQEPPVATPKIASREVVISEAAARVLARSAKAYHSLKSYTDETHVEKVFISTAANGQKQRMPSRQTTRFAWGGPRAFTMRSEAYNIFCSGQVFTNQIPAGSDEQGRRRFDKEVTKLAATGPIDWADAMGNIAQFLCPTTVQSLLMTGPEAGFDLFLSADEVTAGELDERPGVWVSGTGICPYTPVPGGGKEVVPVKAWFSDKTGLLREIRFDISGTQWAQSAAATFGARHQSEATSAGSYVKVSIDHVVTNEPLDEALFTYSDNVPSGGRMEFESIPGMPMGGKPGANAPAAMTPAKPAGQTGMTGMAPATPVAPSGMSGMTPAKPIAPAGMTGMTPAQPIAPAGMTGMTPAQPIAKQPAPSDVISPGEEMRAALMGKPLPAFNTKTVDGKPLSLADLKGKVVFIDFWATWCGPCMNAIPAVQRISEKFKDQPVVILGMNRDKAGDEPKVVRTIERKGLTFLQGMDTDGSIAKQYKITAIPAMILLDKQGVVRQVFVGYSPDEETTIAKEIEALLK
jgi:thiol-disulfide isomerase/thioredoxin